MNRPFVAAILVAAALPGQPSRAQGVTVQLPTYRTFRVATTVSVPDRGSAYLGGVNTARSFRQQIGSPVTRGNRAIGGERQAAGVRISAYVHDHQRLDRELLSGAAPTAAVENKQPARMADPQNEPLLSVAEHKARQQAQQFARQADAKAYYERGLAAAAEGKIGVARIHLQMAARRAAGPYKQRILSKIASLDTATTR